MEGQKIIQANIYQVIKLYWLEKRKDLKKGRQESSLIYDLL